MTDFFADVPPVRYQGPKSDDPLSFRYYDKDRIVLGKRMEEQLRFAVCYWHSFVWNGFDPFGYDGTFRRPWFEAGDPMAQARLKAEVAFDFFSRLGVPYFTFHDRDVAPEGSTPAESKRNLDVVLEHIQGLMRSTGVKLLWGTANLFSNRRYMSGAATNPDPEVLPRRRQVRRSRGEHRMAARNSPVGGARLRDLLNTNMGQSGAWPLLRLVGSQAKIASAARCSSSPSARAASTSRLRSATSTPSGDASDWRKSIPKSRPTAPCRSTAEHEIATRSARDLRRLDLTAATRRWAGKPIVPKNVPVWPSRSTPSGGGFTPAANFEPSCADSHRSGVLFTDTSAAGRRRARYWRGGDDRRRPPGLGVEERLRRWRAS